MMSSERCPWSSRISNQVAVDEKKTGGRSGLSRTEMCMRSTLRLRGRLSSTLWSLLGGRIVGGAGGRLRSGTWTSGSTAGGGNPHGLRDLVELLKDGRVDFLRRHLLLLPAAARGRDSRLLLHYLGDLRDLLLQPLTEFLKHLSKVLETHHGLRTLCLRLRLLLRLRSLLFDLLRLLRLLLHFLDGPLNLRTGHKGFLAAKSGDRREHFVQEILVHDVMV